MNFSDMLILLKSFEFLNSLSASFPSRVSECSSAPTVPKLVFIDMAKVMQWYYIRSFKKKKKELERSIKFKYVFKIFSFILFFSLNQLFSWSHLSIFRSQLHQNTISRVSFRIRSLRIKIAIVRTHTVMVAMYIYFKSKNLSMVMITSCVQRNHSHPPSHLSGFYQQIYAYIFLHLCQHDPSEL